MPSERNVSRTSKSRLGTKIPLALTALVILPFTAIVVVEGQSGVQDPGPRESPESPTLSPSCIPTLNAQRAVFLQQSVASEGSLGVRTYNG